MMQRVRGVCFPVAALAVIAVLASACEPVVEPGSADEGDASDDAPEHDLASLEGAAEAAAREWDAEARLVEVAVRLDDAEAWRETTATYMAPDADRMLVVTVGAAGTSEQELALENLGFSPAPPDALARVPALPGSFIEPGTAADSARSALADCGIDGEPHEVRYASGAPGAWDGSAWEPEPKWALTVIAEDGGVLLRPDGEVPADACFEVPSQP